MKILYVEDNDDSVYMLKSRLSRAGFTVVVTTNGAQGVAMATSEKPDLILMDLTLPNINGEEATWRIKADPATSRIPIIALTASAMAGQGKTLWRQAAMTSIPSRWSCSDCSEKSRP
jgi:CheY-like chemotaxis protein